MEDITVTIAEIDEHRCDLIKYIEEIEAECGKKLYGDRFWLLNVRQDCRNMTPAECDEFFARWKQNIISRNLASVNA